MVIRGEQLRAFQTAAHHNLIDRMCEYTSSCFPAQCENLGVAGVRSLVRYGIYRARSWGFVRERDIASFLAMLILLSPTFDDDPRVPWAKAILSSTAGAPIRMERLWVGLERSLQKFLSA
jgi:hypothetical protein